MQHSAGMERMQPHVWLSGDKAGREASGSILEAGEELLIRVGCVGHLVGLPPLEVALANHALWRCNTDSDGTASTAIGCHRACRIGGCHMRV